MSSVKSPESESKVFTQSSKKYSISSLSKQVKASKPVVLSHDIPPGTKITFVDISHTLATIDIDSKFNKFGALIETANEWLQKNYLWKVESCETVSLVFKNEKLDPVDFGATQRLIRPSVNNDLGDCVLLKGLRLWISRREDMPEMKKHVDIQTLSYHTYLPQGCRFYENQIGWQQLDDVIESVNESIKNETISGHLLNIESIVYDANEEWVVDTESPKCKEYSAKQETAIRVFFVSNAPENDCSLEEVHVFDFVPDVISTTSPPKFEPFFTLLYKLQEFLEEYPEYKYLNSQSVDIKFRTIDEMQTHYMVHNNDVGYYLRILRLVCTKPSPARHRRHLERQLTFDNTLHPNEVNSDESKNTDLEACANRDSTDTKDVFTPSVLNIESYTFEIKSTLNTLHGPFYPLKRAIEDFLERPEWVPKEEKRPDSRWKYLFAETITVLAKNEEEIQKMAENSLFSNRHNLFILIPRIYYAIRIYFDASDVIPDWNYKNNGNKTSLKKCQSERSRSVDKKIKISPHRHQSLPENAMHIVEHHTNRVRSFKEGFKEKLTQSVACSLM